MQVSALPLPADPPSSGWHFVGPWSDPERETLTRALRERILNPEQARAHPWLFLAQGTARYAHCPTIHPSGIGYIASDADDLADVLWEHYFTLHLGPLAWTPPVATSPPIDPAPQPDQAVDSTLEQLRHSWQALDHFQNARALVAEGNYAAAKQEMELSFALSPPSGFFDHRRVELCGDIESGLGNDTVAQRSYQQALDLGLQFRDSWVHTDLRLKLAWCALRLDQVERAHQAVQEALQLCVAAQATETSGKRGLNHFTALAYATLADIAFRAGNTEAARDAAQQAAIMSGRLGSLHAERVRLLTYLAWQLYLHGESDDAQALALRARRALDLWMPLDSLHVRAIRGTISTILGKEEPKPSRRARSLSMPSVEVLTEQAVAAVRGMSDWLRQLLALHTLAPHLKRGHVTSPLTDIHVLHHGWRVEDRTYQDILRADLVHTHARRLDTPLRVARQLVHAEPEALWYLGHQWLYAESLLRVRSHLNQTHRPMIDDQVVRCATTWRLVLSAHVPGERKTNAIKGLAVLLPHLPEDVRAPVIATLEHVLIEQLQTHAISDEAFLAALPAMATFHTGMSVASAILAQERVSSELLIACLASMAHDDASEARDSIVELVLRREHEWLAYSSTTDLGSTMVRLAPYLNAQQAHRALALATPIRSIAVRVRALSVLAQALPSDERAIVYHTAYQAAQRTTEVNVRGEALVALVRSIAEHDWRE
jgi:tetratricopeptide (TPR) repeat protein